MSTLRRSVLLPALAAMATLLAGSAGTMAGTARTWYVGPTAPTGAGAAGGSCASPDHTDLQAAVDASGRGDTIVVCDGRYVDARVSVTGHGHDGLTLVGKTPWGATLLAPSAGVDGGVIEVVGADRVTIQHLRVKGRARCTDGPTAGIFVADGQDVDVRANRVVGVVGDPDCEIEMGILLNESTGWVRYNLVRDWGFLGIDVNFGPAATGRVRVVRNALRFAPPQLPSIPPARIGLSVDSESPDVSATVLGNVVRVPRSLRGTPAAPTLVAGIGVDVEHAVIRDNRAWNADVALGIGGTTDVRVEGNVARGLTLDCDGEPGQIWTDNDGRAWRSDPVGLCTQPR